mmetsp:Transcript_36108/g.78106  ORF Transcript_36108/g.78106 Transcript_36108/m.78106 type:complete len:452 (+) Transcript_36108:194-1549(+)|eukprot:CAMPEP_0206449920 /NCGR_PEP_ID=MMETSP0324_2-20121206/18398_1 /ASSEMBLY_ACC=CAM_ASM_000836 /TAXON_ID=2866 /ORGANISM="Crypthecodinium cohnii, Strain Seligo" /LENGTH=451 /DNA_ID=CAMNT_0053919433 /DNA_START=53 /DNA_END=1408 /DNA_ORIENTATION=-
MSSTLVRGSAVCGAALAGVACYNRMPRSYGDHKSGRQTYFSSFYQSCLVPIIVKTDAEFAHKATIKALSVAQAFCLLGEPLWTGATPLDSVFRPPNPPSTPSGPSLRQELLDGRLVFDSPLGIAAGFDKNADLVPLFRLGTWPCLGFAEVGSISALPSDGNPKPRCFRIPSDEVVVNRMGLNNLGSEAVAGRMKDYEVLGAASRPIPGQPARAPIGVNIAKTHSPDIMGAAAVKDFVASFSRLAPHGDFVVLNVSCPNTAEGKTFEDPQTLAELLAAIKAEKQKVEAESKKALPPIFVKLSPPPLTNEGKAQLQKIVSTAMASGTVDGFVVSNTAGDRDVELTETGKAAAQEIGKGGLSGKPLAARSTAAVKEVYAATKGKVPIIGCGGVDSAEAAYEKIRAGASCVEMYTGMVFKGPMVFFDVHLGLRRLLEKDGFKSIAEAVGADHGKN